jgi:hypothetical protein
MYFCLVMMPEKLNTKAGKVLNFSASTPTSVYTRTRSMLGKPRLACRRPFAKMDRVCSQDDFKVDRS